MQGLSIEDYKDLVSHISDGNREGFIKKYVKEESISGWADLLEKRKEPEGVAEFGGISNPFEDSSSGKTGDGPKKKDEVKFHGIVDEKAQQVDGIVDADKNIDATFKYTASGIVDTD